MKMAASGGVGPRLSGLNVYPIKSARGIALNQSDIDDFGLRYDRRWMVVDQAGKFMSQRSHPRMTLVVPTLVDEMLRVEGPGMLPLQLPIDPVPAITTTVSVWNHACDATWLGEVPARWFSELLGCPASLVHMPDTTMRPANPAYAAEGTRVSFADAYPFLLLSEASLTDLNSRLTDPLPINRFRPNLVVAGCEAYEEDRWSSIQIGGISFEVVKPCDRCVITTTDQMTGERGKEPLRTLAMYRNVDGKVMFGQNLVHRERGNLRVGDRVTTTAPHS
jgi:uncharacterized protein